MRILITGGRSLVGEALAAKLEADHEVITLDLPGIAGDRPLSVVGDLRDLSIATAVRDCDTVIHVLPTLPHVLPDDEVLDFATRGTYNLVTTTRAMRVIVLSSLHMFEQYPQDYLVNEYWVPRPTPELTDLVPYLAELTVRETSRVLSFQALTLRLGNVVDAAAFTRGEVDARSLHVDDAVLAVERAIAFEPTPEEAGNTWWAFHIPGAGERPRFPLGMAGQERFGYRPRHAVPIVSPVAEVPAIKPQTFAHLAGGVARRVVVYGAGGPLAAATAVALAHDHMLRLTDLNPLPEVGVPNPDQHPDAPRAHSFSAPHENCLVDITDAEQALQAAQGMDAIINCSVIRTDLAGAFRVNMLGAYHVMRAAVACGIRRVVHTGPFQAFLLHPAGYWYDYEVGDDVPARPGTSLYILTKFLGQEICRIFAEWYALEVPALLFCNFVNPETVVREALGLYPFSVSWEDAAASLRAALHMPSFPHPFEVLHILADQPHGRFTNEKAKHILGWQPRDRLEYFWLRQ